MLESMGIVIHLFLEIYSNFLKWKRRSKIKYISWLTNYALGFLIEILVDLADISGCSPGTWREKAFLEK